MKLLIQIPCLNEEGTLAQTLKDLPHSIPGISAIEIQIINDGSTDRTEQIAREHGVDHIITFKHNRGLAAAFKAGVENALRVGADILVNTDADNQYPGECIVNLVQPIVRGEADVVIGKRPIKDHPEFSWLKKKLQAIGSWVLRKVSGTTVEDAASGFRAYSQSALMHLNIFSHFSYTMETLIQAGYQNLKVVSVSIRVNPKTRNSRLFRNIFHYLLKSGSTIVNVFLIYRSASTFSFLAVLSFLASVALSVRYVVMVFLQNAPRTSFWPSIILAGCFLIFSIQFYLTGILSTLISSNRKLLEEAVYHLRKKELNSVPTLKRGSELRPSDLAA